MDYKACYDRVIFRAQSRILDKETYCEKHHIVPRCLGGDNKHSNLVKLLPEEHFLCHQILVKLHPENVKLSYAAQLMTRGAKGRRVNNKWFGWLKRRFSEAQTGRKHSAETIAKLKIAQTGIRVGIPLAPEHCAKIGNANRRRRLSNETKAKIAIKSKERANRPEVKEALIARMKGRVTSEETKFKISLAGKGRLVSDETREKLRIVNTGKTIPEEQRLKISIAHMGKKRSPESIAKTVANRHYKHSEETLQKMREARKGVVLPPVSEETRAKMSATRKGKKPSEETKAKMKVAWELRKARGPEKPRERINGRFA